MRLIWAAIAGMVAFLVWHILPQEPRYEGRTFGEWFGEVRIAGNLKDEPGRDPALIAIKAMGPDAARRIAMMMRLLNGTPYADCRKQVARVAPSVTAGDAARLDRCFLCLVELGPDAEEAVPELIELARSNDVKRSRLAINVLGWIHVQPRISVPFLTTTAVSHPSRTTRIAALRALFAYGAPAKSSLAPLTAQLKVETDPMMAREIREFLEKMGVAAPPIPAVMTQGIR